MSFLVATAWDRRDAVRLWPCLSKYSADWVLIPSAVGINAAFEHPQLVFAAVGFIPWQHVRSLTADSSEQTRKAKTSRTSHIPPTPTRPITGDGSNH